MIQHTFVCPPGAALWCQYEPSPLSGPSYHHWVLGKPLGEKLFSQYLAYFFCEAALFKLFFSFCLSKQLCSRGGVIQNTLP